MNKSHAISIRALEKKHIAVIPQTYHRIRSRLLSKARHIRRHYTQHYRQIGAKGHVDAILKEARPAILRVDLADHDRSGGGDGRVGGDEVGSRVFQIRRAARRYEDEDALESDCQDLYEEGVEDGEAEAFDQD
jgi:hypothetical protein